MSGSAVVRLTSFVPAIAENRSVKISVSANAVLFITAPNNNTLNYPLSFMVFQSTQLWLTLFYRYMSKRLNGILN